MRFFIIYCVQPLLNIKKIWLFRIEVVLFFSFLTSFVFLPELALAQIPHPVVAGGATGKFIVSDGKIIDPTGKEFTAKGINVGAEQMNIVSTNSKGQPLTTLFSGINHVRLNSWYNSPYTIAQYQRFITQLTSLGIVVEIEDHTASNGSGSGGNQGVIFTGRLLTDEVNWFASLASAFKDNPYVWFGTTNEPSTAMPDGTNSPAGLSSWQQSLYQAIRNTGNHNVIEMEAICWPNPVTCNQGFTPSVYAGMINIVWDMHYYGWMNSSLDVPTLIKNIGAFAAATQQISSADGIVPVIIGEYGNSTNGSTMDTNGSAVVQAVHGSGYGTDAWHWGGGGGEIDNLTTNGSLTSYGRRVARHIATQSGEYRKLSVKNP